ncbi:MAG TPA: hypothetical protein VIV34_11185 [Pseudolabrys sp.]
MPNRRPSSGPSETPPQKRQSFRKRYDELEVRRAELSTRLHLLGETAQRHPGYKRALKLLNDVYRKEKLARRLAVLHAAAWLIDILEKLTSAL